MQPSGRQWRPGPGVGATADAGEGAVGPYLRAVRAHWLLVLLVAAAVVGAAALWAQVRPVEYEAGAQMLVTPLPADETAFIGLPYIRDTGDPPRTLQTAATLIDSERAAALAARRLGPEWTREEVERAIEVNPQGQSSVLDVTAVAEDPQEAARVANRYVTAVLDVRRATLEPLVAAAIESTRDQLSRVPDGTTTAQTLADRLSRLQSVADGEDPTLSISQPASPPTESVGSSRLLVLVIALLVGLVLGSVVALLVELLRPRRVTDEDELLGVYPLPVLTRVPEISRRARRMKGASPLATPPLVREGFRTLQVQLELEAGQHRSILVTSASSADGKTTSAINFALELVSSGQRVVLLDLDLRKPDVGPALGLDRRADVAALAEGRTTLTEQLAELPAVSGLHVLAVGQQEGFQVLEQLARRLPDLVEEALSLADYVVIDTAPLGEVSDALPLVRAVDDVLLVARLGNTRVANVEMMRDLLTRVDREPIGWLLIGASTRLVSTSYYYAGRPAVGEPAS
jgi:Mrp family chromosome partitioning ATPase/capsular polysaccharide biosynthesis protein